MALELGKPRYDARTRTVRFGARALEELSPGISHFGADADERLPARFAEPALFIDDVITSGQGYCGYLGQVDLFPANVRPGAYLQADGRLLRISAYSALYSLVGSTFGGDDRNTFAIPDLTAPDFLAYQLCANGIYPRRFDDDYDGPAECDVGEIVLEAQTFAPGGWVPADGRQLRISQAQALYNLVGRAFGGDGRTTFNVPSITPSKSANGRPLTPYVCAGGEPWRPGQTTAEPCTQSQVTLFATTATQLPSNYTPADGRLLPITPNQVMYSLLGNTFGGDGIQAFALPKLASPVAGTTYAVCMRGYYPHP